MPRIDDIFQSLRSVGYKTIMPFVCAGHPRPGQLADILAGVQQAGCAIAEVGFPFSDPIADGPVIASAMHAALRAGVSPTTIFDEVRALRNGTGLGLVAMVSVSIVLRMGGPDAFVAKAKEAGFDGLIVPDVPLEESSAIREACRQRGLSLSLLIAPTTPQPRADEIARACTGFVYLLARTGITGSHSSDGPPQTDLASRIDALRKVTSLPIACGFGIASREQVAAVTKFADAAIVGSALVQRLSQAQAARRPLGQEAREFLVDLAAGLS